MKKIVITLMLLFFSFSFLASDYVSPVLAIQNSTITANFQASPSSGVAPLSVQFNDLSTGSPTAWEWNFGDGYTSKERNPTHTYSSGGIYTVTFSVSAGTDTDTETVTINVGTASNPPVVAFSASPISGNAPLTVAFTDTSTGSPTSWLWNFGDGTTSTFQSPSHTYYGVGTYTVSLTVKDVAGSTATKSNYITVTSVTPTITWSKPADITFGTALSSTQLNAVAYVPGTFVYTPQSGTVLSAGTQTLSVVFTPMDTASYNTASKDVTINVLTLLTPVQKIRQMTTTVQSLVISGVLTKNEGNKLNSDLNTAIKYLDAKKTNSAIKELNAFIIKIEVDVQRGKLSSTQGQALVDAANSVINML